MNIHKHDDKSLEARAAERGDVAVVVDVRVSGGVKTKARLLDLSETGFRMDCMTVFVTDQSFFMTIPTFAQLEARIVWQNQLTYGCEFVRPLYAAIFAHILKAHPAFNRPL